MGKWIRRDKDIPKVPPHVHDTPIYNDTYDVAVGDIWRCSCFTYFQVDRLNPVTQDGQTIHWRPMWPDETKDFK